MYYRCASNVSQLRPRLTSNHIWLLFYFWLHMSKIDLLYLIMSKWLHFVIWYTYVVISYWSTHTISRSDMESSFLTAIALLIAVLSVSKSRKSLDGVLSLESRKRLQSRKSLVCSLEWVSEKYQVREVFQVSKDDIAAIVWNVFSVSFIFSLA